MPAQTFLPVLYELVRTYQAFESYSAPHVRSMGLTSPQFDIIATLGNTPGMSFKELGEKTLITKGTLTGVVDRLVDKKLVKRVACPLDGRKQYVQLTKAGEAMFAKVFPEHLAYLQHAFAGFKQQDYEYMAAMLRQLKNAFHEAGTIMEEEA